MRVPPAPVEGQAAQDRTLDVEVVDETASTCSANPASPQAFVDPWQPVGSVLERLFQMLDFVPEADDEDESWRRWHCRPGDVVEVLGAKGDVLARHFVTHASPAYLKIDDRRVFAQRGGWPIASGKRSPIRARKVKE